MFSFNKQSGFSLMDAILGVSLMVVVFFAIVGVFRLSIELVGSSKSKVGAIALAQEQMEFIRNLSYENVGTVGGIPSGNLNQSEVVSLNNISYTRDTLIQYVDAPEDGVGGADTNGITTDYKLVKVTVSWQLKGEGRSVFLVSNISPRGLESTLGGGTLIINTQDSLGTPLAGANINIVNTNPDPDINLNVISNIDGQASFPGAPALSDYEIIVSLAGFSTAQTYTADVSNPNPNPGHLTVVEGESTVSTFQIDRLSSKTINTLIDLSATNTVPLANIPFSMRGDKIIGTDDLDNPIYKYQTNLQTNGEGTVTVSSLEWDNYTITIDNVGIGYDISESCDPQPFSLSPNVSTSTNITLTAHTPYSLHVSVTDSSGVLLSGATTRLYGHTIDSTKETSDCGQTFFGGILQGDSYSIDVSLIGYTNETITDVVVDGNSEITVVLN